jgi:hypothetical protein
MSELYRFNETDKQVLAAIGRWVKRLAAWNSTPSLPARRARWLR